MSNQQQQQQQQRKLTFYWNPACPYVQRSLIALQEKGVVNDADHNIERVFISLKEEAPEWYKKINPKETVPCLVVDGVETPVYESNIIAEYFDRSFGAKNQLLPAVPQIRAEIRAFQAVCTKLISAVFGVFFASEKERSEATKRAQSAVHHVEKALESRHAAGTGPFFLGPQFSMADIHIVPFLARFRLIAPFTTGHWDPVMDAPLLRKLRDAALARPSVFNTLPTESELLEGFAGYLSHLNIKVPNVRVMLDQSSPIAARVPVGAALAGLVLDTEAASPEKAHKYHLPKVTFLGATAYGATAGLLLLQETVAPTLLPGVGQDELAGRAQFVAGEADEFATAIATALKKDASETDQADLVKAVTYMDGLVKGPFVLGNQSSIADAALIPLVHFLSRVRPESLATAVKLQGLVAQALTVPDVQKALDDISVTPDGVTRFVEEEA